MLKNFGIKYQKRFFFRMDEKIKLFMDLNGYRLIFRLKENHKNRQKKRNFIQITYQKHERFNWSIFIENFFILPIKEDCDE